MTRGTLVAYTFTFGKAKPTVSAHYFLRPQRESQIRATSDKKEQLLGEEAVEEQNGALPREVRYARSNERAGDSR